MKGRRRLGPVSHVGLLPGVLSVITEGQRSLTGVFSWTSIGHGTWSSKVEFRTEPRSAGLSRTTEWLSGFPKNNAARVVPPTNFLIIIWKGRVTNSDFMPTPHIRTYEARQSNEER